LISPRAGFTNGFTVIGASPMLSMFDVIRGPRTAAGHADEQGAIAVQPIRDRSLQVAQDSHTPSAIMHAWQGVCFT
jgi:hypothetical protein